MMIKSPSQSDMKFLVKINSGWKVIHQKNKQLVAGMMPKELLKNKDQKKKPMIIVISQNLTFPHYIFLLNLTKNVILMKSRLMLTVLKRFYQNYLMIKEKDLIELGFERQDNTPESSGAPNNWHYYTLDIKDLSLISDDSDEVKDNNWKVYMFNYDGFELTELGKLKSFIDVLKSAVKK